VKLQRIYEVGDPEPTDGLPVIDFEGDWWKREVGRTELGGAYVWRCWGESGEFRYTVNVPWSELIAGDYAPVHREVGPIEITGELEEAFDDAAFAGAQQITSNTVPGLVAAFRAAGFEVTE